VIRRLVAPVVCALLLAGCGTGQSTPGERPTSSAEKPTPEQPALDVSDMENLHEMWWTWVARAPKERNPATDTTGKLCANDQPVGVWFVAPSYGLPVTRHCSMPADVPLAGPAVNLLSGVPGDCKRFMAGAKAAVTLDGDAVPSKAVDDEYVTFSALAGNAYTGETGVYTIHGCRLWFSVPGLEPGEHTLTIQGSSEDVAGNVTYELTVTAARSR